MKNLIFKNYNIFISLFTECNLNCKFCFQQNKKKLDKNYILNNFFKNFQNIISDIIINDIKSVNIIIWGGQLFNDNYSQQYYIFYKEFIQKIKKYFILYKNILLNISFISNGIFTNKKRVYNFLLSVNGNISFSYDPCGRYLNNIQLQNLKQNIQFFKNKLNNLSLTLTKPNIKYLISTDDQIINNNKIDINYYYPNKKWKQYMPTDELLYQFFYWGIKNKKTNISIIKNIIFSYFDNNTYNHKDCNCKFTIQFINGQWTKNCIKRLSSLSLQNFYDKHTNKITESNCNQMTEKLAITKRGCLYCQNYSKCIMICFGIQIFKNYKINYQFCPLKKIYNYIQNNINEYIEFK